MPATQNGKIVLSQMAVEFGRRIAVLVDGGLMVQAHAALDELAQQMTEQQGQLYSIPLDEVPVGVLDLPPHTIAALESRGILYMADLAEFTPTDLALIPRIPQKSARMLAARVTLFLARRAEAVKSI